MAKGYMQEGVILLHGMFLTSRSMQRFAKFLQKHNYQTLNLNYPSTRQPIEEIIQEIHPLVTAFSDKIFGKVHFVGHSMGGLVIRAYIHLFSPQKLGRVVMLGTPNHGSEVADFLKNWWLYKKLFGPAGQQLVTRLENSEQLFGAVNYELGVIAGNRWIDPFSSWLIGNPNDGKVSIVSTKIEGMVDHIVIPATHIFLPQNQEARRQTLYFLKQGKFNKS